MRAGTGSSSPRHDRRRGGWPAHGGSRPTARALLALAVLGTAVTAVTLGLSIPALAGPWSSSTSVDSAPITSVSCATATFCVAVDQAGSALTYDGSSWSSPVDIDGATALDSVSCPFVRFCMAVDAGGQALAYNGTSWLPPTDIDGSYTLESVSCPSSAFCQAVDDDGHVVNFDTRNYPVWSAPVDIDGSNLMTAVSCVSSGFCMAVDQTGNAFNYFAGQWVSDRTGVGTPLDAVSCPTTSFCVAVDDAGDALVYSGGIWASSPTDVDGSEALTSVDCLSVAFCMATDLSGDTVSYLDGTWTTPSDIDAANSLNAVSCPMTSMCVAVDVSGGALVYSSPVLITTTSLPDGSSSTAYSTTLGATGGDPPYHWSERGALPPGLHLDHTSGVIFGTPRKAGVYGFTVFVSDRMTQKWPHTDNVAYQELSITVEQEPVFTSRPKVITEGGVAFSFVVRTAGYPTASVSESGSLPSGVTFTDNGNGTATLSGTVASGTPAAYPLTLSAVNANGTTTQDLRLVVR